ncbi:glycosyltransferase family 4 protein [Arthrobacter sp. NA-172]|uniref:glycosyltransferase family 4 protein n=1 Tax=Arthrobacter sp. NA-172 TaxID=3367524 RepID=UPI0037545EE8
MRPVLKSGTASIYVDQRWIGHHGIARFGREVIARFPVPFKTLESPLKPASPFDAFNLARLKLSPHDILFTPGFNAGICRGAQILTIHDLIHLDISEESSVLKKAYYDLVVRPTVANARLVFTVSETSREKIRSWLDDDRIRVVNVGNGVSEDFSIVQESSTASPTNFVFVGNLKAHKNLRSIFQALRLRPSFSVAVVSSDEAGIRLLAHEFGVDSQIRVYSHLSDSQLAELYRQSAALLFPSILEGFGLPAVEAIRCGTRVAYWAGCSTVAEIARDHGIAVDDAHDPEGWAFAMDACSRLSEEGPIRPDDHWKSRYDWQNVARNVSDALLAYHRA